jgi:hypothetical protein
LSGFLIGNQKSNGESVGRTRRNELDDCQVVNTARMLLQVAMQRQVESVPWVLLRN